MHYPNNSLRFWYRTVLDWKQLFALSFLSCVNRLLLCVSQSQPTPRWLERNTAERCNLWGLSHFSLDPARNSFLELPQQILLIPFFIVIHPSPSLCVGDFRCIDLPEFVLDRGRPASMLLRVRPLIGRGLFSCRSRQRGSYDELPLHVVLQFLLDYCLVLRFAPLEDKACEPISGIYITATAIRPHITFSRDIILVL